MIDSLPAPKFHVPNCTMESKNRIVPVAQDSTCLLHCIKQFYVKHHTKLKRIVWLFRHNLYA